MGMVGVTPDELGETIGLDFSKEACVMMYCVESRLPGLLAS